MLPSFIQLIFFFFWTYWSIQSSSDTKGNARMNEGFDITLRILLSKVQDDSSWTSSRRYQSKLN